MHEPPAESDRPRIAVRAIVLDARGRVLVLKRAAGTAAAGRWCLPGGKVDFGETAEAALARELREESGLACTGTRFLFYQDSLPGEDTPAHFVNLYFECAAAGEVSLNAESSDHAWIAREDLGRVALAFRNGEGLLRYWS